MVVRVPHEYEDVINHIIHLQVMLNGSCVPQSQCPCSVVSLLSVSHNLTLDLQEQEVPAGTIIPDSCNSWYFTFILCMVCVSLINDL